MQFRVDSRMADCFNLCRPSALLGFLQEAATEHFFQMHVPALKLIETIRCGLDYDAAVVRLATLLRAVIRNVRTWQRGGVGAVVYRDYDRFVGETEWERRLPAGPFWMAIPIVRRGFPAYLDRDGRGENIKGGFFWKNYPRLREFSSRRAVRIYSDCDHKDI
jgi:hypothetical protein